MATGPHGPAHGRYTTALLGCQEQRKGERAGQGGRPLRPETRSLEKEVVVGLYAAEAPGSCVRLATLTRAATGVGQGYRAREVKCISPEGGSEGKRKNGM